LLQVIIHEAMNAPKFLAEKGVKQHKILQGSKV
jgi:hypothetical protein